MFIIGSAWFDARPGEQRWKAFHHGAPVEHALVLCDCPVCVERLGQLTTRREPPPPPQPEPPKRVDAGPVREHVLELLGSGMSRDGIATAAGVDRSTVCRVLQPYAARVSVDTAAALLTVGV